MKRFVFVFICFGILYFAMIASIRVLWVQTAPLRLERNFINEDIHTVVLGPSNGQFGWNDSIIPHSCNFCASGSSLGVSYSTLKWITEYNDNQVDTIVLCASIFPFAYYHFQDLGLLTHISWQEQNSILDYHSFFKFFCTKLPFWENFFTRFPIWLLNERKIGGSFINSERNELGNSHLYDQINQAMSQEDGFTLKYFRNHSKYQIEYLKKIKLYCDEHKKTLIILSTPVYKIPDMIDDSGYRQLIRAELGDSALIADYSRFEFPDSSYYGDLEHLNNKGAEYFSRHIAQNGLKLSYAIDYCK